MNEINVSKLDTVLKILKKMKRHIKLKKILKLQLLIIHADFRLSRPPCCILVPKLENYPR